MIVLTDSELRVLDCIRETIKREGRAPLRKTIMYDANVREWHVSGILEELEKFGLIEFKKGKQRMITVLPEGWDYGI